jgi:hypothetical protein
MGPVEMGNFLEMLRQTTASQIRYYKKKLLEAKAKFWLQRLSRQLHLHHSTKQSGSSHGEN